MERELFPPSSQISEMQLLSLLGPAQRQELLGAAPRRTYPRQAMVYAPHDPCQVVYYLVSGGIKIYDMTTDGREIIFRICEPDTLFGLSAIFGGQFRLVFAQALSDSRVLAIPRDTFERTIDGNPRLAMAVIYLLGRRLRRAHAAIAEFVAGDTRSRLAYTLLKFDHASRAPGAEASGRPTHQEIADMIGATRTTVTKILNEWKRRGHIRSEGRRIVVNDHEALTRLTRR